jgi:hypothetical protein
MYGYHFQQNGEAHYPTTVCRYPAAFMSQPEFVSLEGRNHGRITYDVTLRFARRGAKLSPAERNELFAEMEEQLMEMFVTLSREPFVVVVERLTIAPTSESIDSHGAIAMEANARVVTIF